MPVCFITSMDTKKFYTQHSRPSRFVQRMQALYGLPSDAKNFEAEADEETMENSIPSGSQSISDGDIDIHLEPVIQLSRVKMVGDLVSGSSQKFQTSMKNPELRVN